MAAEDYRNARRDDPWTSLAGTTGISHKELLLNFLRSHDREQGWTNGELSAATELAYSQAWRRASDLVRDGLAYVVTGAERVWAGTGKTQQARRAVMAGQHRAAPLTADDLDRISDLGAERDDYGPELEAQYGGRCACGGRYIPGDMIRWSEDDGAYIHSECAG